MWIAHFLLKCFTLHRVNTFTHQIVLAYPIEQTAYKSGSLFAMPLSQVRPGQGNNFYTIVYHNLIIYGSSYSMTPVADQSI